MTKTARPARAGQSDCLDTSKLQPYGAQGLSLVLIAMVIGSFPNGEANAQAVSPATLCLPPEEPFVPATDEDFRAYADMVSGDFERYFTELTTYFSCMDSTRQAVFDRARVVSQDHQTFWQRAKALGVAEKAALMVDPAAKDAE
ncbi:hypothetical protein ACFFUC_11665 [Paracoccus cavernae]|uniref:hypothetical protein n=1 Tax=Paracoccus cavernae TaxID=1571207 RepID=UPI0035F4EF23